MCCPASSCRCFCALFRSSTICVDTTAKDLWVNMDRKAFVIFQPLSMHPSTTCIVESNSNGDLLRMARARAPCIGDAFALSQVW